MKTTMTLLEEAAELESKLQKHADRAESARLALLERQADALAKLEAKHKDERAAIVAVYSPEAVELLNRLATKKAAE